MDDERQQQDLWRCRSRSVDHRQRQRLSRGGRCERDLHSRPGRDGGRQPLPHHDHVERDNSGTFTINKKNATWTTNPASKTYGDADPVPLTTGSGSSFLASDGVSATYTRAPGETVAGSPYHITATLSATVAGALNNYNITNNGADFTINKKAATWTTNANSKTYGYADPSPLTTGSGSGFVAADGVSASYSRAPGETVAGSPYHITATLSATVAGALGNYDITNAGADV